MIGKAGEGRRASGTPGSPSLRPPPPPAESTCSPPSSNPASLVRDSQRRQVRTRTRSRGMATLACNTPPDTTSPWCTVRSVLRAASPAPIGPPYDAWYSTVRTGRWVAHGKETTEGCWHRPQEMGRGAAMHQPINPSTRRTSHLPTPITRSISSRRSCEAVSCTTPHTPWSRAVPCGHGEEGRKVYRARIEGDARASVVLRSHRSGKISQSGTAREDWEGR